MIDMFCIHHAGETETDGINLKMSLVFSGIHVSKLASYGPTVLLYMSNGQNTVCRAEDVSRIFSLRIYKSGAMGPPKSDALPEDDKHCPSVLVCHVLFLSRASCSER